MITIEEQIAEVRRELGMRRHKYPQWVAAGRMTQQQADDRLGRLEAVLDTLTTVRAERDAKANPGLF